MEANWPRAPRNTKVDRSLLCSRPDSSPLRTTRTHFFSQNFVNLLEGGTLLWVGSPCTSHQSLDWQATNQCIMLTWRAGQAFRCPTREQNRIPTPVSVKYQYQSPLLRLLLLIESLISFARDKFGIDAIVIRSMGFLIIGGRMFLVARRIGSRGSSSFGLPPQCGKASPLLILLFWSSSSSNITSSGIFGSLVGRWPTTTIGLRRRRGSKFGRQQIRRGVGLLFRLGGRRRR
jgi:hypothetical protein